VDIVKTALNVILDPEIIDAIIRKLTTDALIIWLTQSVVRFLQRTSLPPLRHGFGD
jgi:hypothetical protein